jgi:hypothetical protein
MGPKRLVLLVEGQGDVQAAPVLVERLLKEYHAVEPVFDVVILDGAPVRVGEFAKIRRNRDERERHDFAEWRRLLNVAVRARKNVGGCILLLDGDTPLSVEGKPFCAAAAARILAAEGKKVGAGACFSLGVVFACMEFESWLIAGIESLQEQRFANDRQGVKKLTVEIPSDPETAPRDAKAWLGKVMTMGYQPPRDQRELTRLVDLARVRARKLRSFRRLESTVKQMIAAIRSGHHVVSPVPQ